MSAPTVTSPLPRLSRVIITPAGSGPNAWIRAQLGGMATPGTIPVGGLRGFRRKTGWDVKAGKGTQGATLTLKTVPPVKGIVTLQLITAQDFADLDAFVEQVLSISPLAQAADGLTWYYPGHAPIGLTQVVVEEYSGIEYQGHGMHHFHFELLEWSPPPPASIVKTVETTAQETEGYVLVRPEDPTVAALKRQIAAASAAAAAGTK